MSDGIIFIIKIQIYATIADRGSVDFYLPRDHKILHSNTIKNLLFFACNYRLVRNTFKGIGSCDIIPLSRPDDFEKLAKYYLVWYNPTAIKKVAIVAMIVLVMW